MTITRAFLSCCTIALLATSLAAAGNDAADLSAPAASAELLRAAASNAQGMEPLPGVPANQEGQGTPRPSGKWDGVKLGVLHYEIVDPNGVSRRVDQDLYGSRYSWGGADTASLIARGTSWFEPGPAIQSAKYEGSHLEGRLIGPWLRTDAFAVIREANGMYFDIQLADAEGHALKIEKTHRTRFLGPKVKVKQVTGERYVPELKVIVSDDFTINFPDAAPGGR